MILSSKKFVEELEASNAVALARISELSQQDEPGEEMTPRRLLILALKNELEATECAAGWIATTPEIKVKLAFARQAGDEAKHYRLIERRLQALGFDTTTHDPFAQGTSPLLDYLRGLVGTAARVAAAQFTREELALVRNAEFIRFCRSRKDEETAKLYEDVIQPDEQHHHELGREILLEIATTSETQAAARAAAARTLELAEELQEVARLRYGVTRPPGC